MKKTIDQLDHFLDSTKNKNPNYWRWCYGCSRDWIINAKKHTLKCTTFGCKSLEVANENDKLQAVYAIVFAAYDDLKL
jgi:hypothetical protein|tara:strand:+ start:195 stop:428 length:234 start_codon:yes stop_codon:yes gene_type:complete